MNDPAPIPHPETPEPPPFEPPLPDPPTPAPPPLAAAPSGVEPARRLTSLDALRGLTMLLMVSSGFGLDRVADQFPESSPWQEIEYQFTHAAWSWGGLWDMIQPMFMFLVGVSMAYSYARRAEKGQSWKGMALHAARRALILVALGVILRSWWTFEDVLAQIGLGYFFLFLFWNRSWKIQAAGVLVILVGYWALFAFWPAPGPDHDPAALGVTTEFTEEHGFTGFAAQWNKNANPAHEFDHWLLNQFPQRGEGWTHNSGGYHTLSFIPSLATMLLGLIAGELLRSSRSGGRKILLLIAAGGIGLGLAVLLHTTGICPVVKRIWTPSWVLYSGGIVAITLALFYGLIDGTGFPPLRWLAWPAVVVGMNSIAIYVMSKLLPGWISRTIRGLGGEDVYQVFDGLQEVMVDGELVEKMITYAPVVERTAVLLVLWFICWRLYVHRIFIRI